MSSVNTKGAVCQVLCNARLYVKSTYDCPFPLADVDPVSDGQDWKQSKQAWQT